MSGNAADERQSGGLSVSLGVADTASYATRVAADAPAAAAADADADAGDLPAV